MYKTGLYLILLFFVFSFFACGKTESAMKPPAKERNNESAVNEKNSGNPSGTKVNSCMVTFVEIGSLRCVPCKMMQPVIKKVADRYGEKVKIIFHDVWTPEGRPYGKKYGIRAIPTQVFLDKAGKEFFRHTGYFPFEKIEALLTSRGVR